LAEGYLSKKLFARYPLIQAERLLQDDHPIIVNGDVSPSIAVTVHNLLFLNRSASARRWLECQSSARPQASLTVPSSPSSSTGVIINRKNWLHVGSERTGPRLAAVLPVVETCRRHQIPIRQ
jgi:hypothetical protein